MIYNADCLASNRDKLAEQIDGVQLRYHYLKRLLEIERRGRSERQMVDMVVPPDKTLRIKRRRVPEDISGDEPDPKPQSKKSRRVFWAPPSHLGPQEAWIEERNRLVGISSKDRRRKTVARPWERAEELLQMIEAIGSEEVMKAWDNAIAEEKSHIRLAAAETPSTAKAICRLVERAQVRSFKDKVLLRVGKWMFSMKILQDVGKFRMEGAPSKQSGFKAGANDKGNAVTRALSKFIDEAHPELQGPNLAKERELRYHSYREWWWDSQIWILLYNAFGAAILLLIPGGHRTKGGYSVSNKQ